MCNGSDTINGDPTEPVMLQYRTSGDWDHLLTISFDGGKHQIIALLFAQFTIVFNMQI